MCDHNQQAYCQSFQRRVKRPLYNGYKYIYIYIFIYHLNNIRTSLVFSLWNTEMTVYVIINVCVMMTRNTSYPNLQTPSGLYLKKWLIEMNDWYWYHGHLHKSTRTTRLRGNRYEAFRNMSFKFMITQRKEPVYGLLTTRWYATHIFQSLYSYWFGVSQQVLYKGLLYPQSSFLHRKWTATASFYGLVQIFGS